MSRRRKDREIGVSQAMLDSFGDVVFDLSHNKQRRRGDPVRLGQFDQVEAGRADMGLTDAEIADTIGLGEDQVIYIRNIIERRRFRKDRYRRLFALGGGKRYRAEQDDAKSKPRGYDADGWALREAMCYPPDAVRRYVASGHWRSDTLTGWLSRHALERPNATAIVTPDGPLDFAAFADRVDRLARSFAGLGLGPGDVIAVQLPNVEAYLVCYCAILRLGAVMTTLYLPHRTAELTAQLAHSRARVYVGVADIDGFKRGPYGVVAGRRIAPLAPRYHGRRTGTGGFVA